MAQKTYNAVFLLILVVFVFYSACFLTTKPRLWIDEALTVGVARSFAENTVLDVSDSPSGYTGFGMLLQQTGYPVTIPLALAIKIFGLSAETVRIFMLIIAAGALTLVWHVGPKLFGRPAALTSLFLIVSFASFHNARTAVGDLPGFAFMLAGLYFWFGRRQLAYAGILLGLAIVTKPSVYALIIPAIIIMFIFRRVSLKDIAYIAVSMIPPGLLWIFLSSGNPLSASFWSVLAGFYANPYGGDISANIVSNLKSLVDSSTLIYFGLLFVVVLAARIWKIRGKEALFYDFVLIYNLLAFVYFLRSPGWLRYLIAAELLILFLLPNTLYKFSESSKFFSGFLKKPFGEKLVPIFMGGLVLVQAVQLLFFADIFYSKQSLALIDNINERYPDSEILAVNFFDISVFLDSRKRYNIIRLVGVPEVGRNVLEEGIRPNLLLVSPKDEVFSESENIIYSNYSKADWTDSDFVFELK